MVWGQNVQEIFGKSLHRTNRLVYRLLTLNFVSFLTKMSTRQPVTIANSNGGISDGIWMKRFWNVLHCVPTNFVSFLYTHKLI